MKRDALILSFVPFAFACVSPGSHACASTYSASSTAASSFCATFTASMITATTGILEAFLSNCDSSTKYLSSACSYLGTAAAPTVAASSNVIPVYPTSVVPTSAPSALVTNTAHIAKVAKAATSSAAEIPTSDSVPTASSSFAGNGGMTCTVFEYAAISSAVATLELHSLWTGAAVIFARKTTSSDTVDSGFDPIVISGTSVTITGANGHVIDGNGLLIFLRPDHFIVVKDMYNPRIENLNIQNWPVHCFDIERTEHLIISGLTLDNSAGDAVNSKIHNHDDCVAATSGTDIVVNGMYGYGGHGLRIGSIGGKSDKTVNGVTFPNSQFLGSQNGCGTKTNSGEKGDVQNILYQNITLSDITEYGIDIQQDYLNGGPTGEPANGVTISIVTWLMSLAG
ncbi:glycosyl hydrolases family 28-domain-containing protein [Aspergillus alliaceus]|uniref:Pectinase D n=1 Tax=Petromyces alliaceus TaxID=209559 RepID=A0A5N7C062_PETAA|nr:glycosyl hydrolases family 28-domain-containing protein [Aspergillus alliaceus]